MLLAYAYKLTCNQKYPSIVPTFSIHKIDYQVGPFHFEVMAPVLKSPSSASSFSAIPSPNFTS